VKVRRVLCSLWLALIVTGCAGNTLQSYQPKNNDESLIVASLMRIPTGISTKSVETILQAYAEDAYVGNFNKYLGVATGPFRLPDREAGASAGVHPNLSRGQRNLHGREGLSPDRPGRSGRGRKRSPS